MNLHLLYCSVDQGLLKNLEFRTKLTLLANMHDVQSCRLSCYTW